MKKILWVFIFLLLSCLSYLREIVFLSINAIIAGTDNFYAKTTRIDFFIDKSPTTLIQYKYLLTIIFTLLFAGVTIIGLKKIFQQKVSFYISTGIYLLTVVVGAVVILYSFLTGSFSGAYSFLRLIIEYLHNPLIFIVVSAAYLGYFYSQEPTNS